MKGGLRLTPKISHIPNDITVELKLYQISRGENTKITLNMQTFK